MEGERTVTNQRKFEGLKEHLLQENEAKYGTEIREIYGEQSVQLVNNRFREMTEEQFKAAQVLEQQLFERLKEAMEEGNPTSDVAEEVAELHKRWLSFYWPKYTKEAHQGLAQMYIADERFIAYYDEQVKKGATQFLHDAIVHYAKI